MSKTTTKESLAEKTRVYIDAHPSIKDCVSKGLINYSSLARIIMKEERLVENSYDMGVYWRDAISKIDTDEIVDIRGFGLMIGIEMRSKANDFRKYCLENGVLVNVCHGNTVRLIPPLIIGKQHCDVLTGLLRDFLE